MQSEDRLVHFSTELIHAPKQHSRQVLQKLYYELSQTRGLAYDSTDFSQAPHARFYSKRGKKAQSVALFLPDRIALVEEWADIALSEFLEKVRGVGRRGLTDLGLKVFVGQTATLRSTFALTHFEDAREFLLDHACQQAERIGPHFQRPVATGGLRFVLPETAENPGNLHVVIESYRHNAHEVFVEVKGVFGRQQIDVETLEKAVEHIQVCRRFISANVFPFLNQYDTPKEGLV